MRDPHQDRAAHLLNKEDREEYKLLMAEAVSLSQRSAALRKRAWEIYSARNDKQYA